MTQPNIDDKFLSGLHLMIDSIESSYFAKSDDDAEDDLPEADHWCPDVQAWHTSDHEPAQAPSVHVNVDGNNGDDPYQSENKVEKLSVAETLKDVNHGRDRIESEYDQNTNLDRHAQENTPDSIAEPFLNRYDTHESAEEMEEREESEEDDVEKSHHDEHGGSHQVRRDPQPPEEEPKPKYPGPKRVPEEDEKPKHGPLKMSLDNSSEFIDSLVRTHAKSIDILKIWGSVDRVLPRTSSETQLVDDLNILKSFMLDETTNIEDLVQGTLVHKMLTDRASRPTAEWWESSMSIAKSIDAIDEPAFFSAFLYYEPDTFDVSDFINIEKAGDRAVAQDLEMMPNSSGGSAIDGLGLSADGHHPGPEDEDCD